LENHRKRQSQDLDQILFKNGYSQLITSPVEQMIHDNFLGTTLTSSDPEIAPTVSSDPIFSGAGTASEENFRNRNQIHLQCLLELFSNLNQIEQSIGNLSVFSADHACMLKFGDFDMAKEFFLSNLLTASLNNNLENVIQIPKAMASASSVLKSNYMKEH
jgi:hypothetical protein